MISEPASATRHGSSAVRPLLDRERTQYLESIRTSQEFYKVAQANVPQGVQSSFHSGSACPIYFESGQAGEMRSVDGRTYKDFHAGSGALLAGHANPEVTGAARAAINNGMGLAAPSTHSHAVAIELSRRYELDKWRFVNSGTEATMAAIRLARAKTGRDFVVKVEGSYHGHHDPVLVSFGSAEKGTSSPDISLGVPASDGIPRATSSLTRVVPYNSPAALAEVFAEFGDQIAAVIVELPMCTPILIEPTNEFLDAIRSLPREHGALLIADEVRSGVVVAAGGGCEAYRIRPDIATLAKSIGGGCAIGAIGASDDVMAVVEEGRVPIYGTMNGNPLAMAAATATLRSVLTASAYSHVGLLARRIHTGLVEIIEEHSLPTRVVTVGPMGCLTMSRELAIDHATWDRSTDRSLTELFWLYQINRGVYLGPTPLSRWTVMVPHSVADVDQLILNTEQFAQELHSISHS